MAVSGLLYSQIGYDAEAPVRLAVRASTADFLTDNACCELERTPYPLVYWGEIWGAHWWVVEIPPLPEGTYEVRVRDVDRQLFSTSRTTIGPSRLWEQTWRHCSFRMLERRKRFAKAGKGWFDAGMLWQEANSHAAMIIGLCDLLDFAGTVIADEERTRIAAQIRNGCDYLALCQDKAAALGKGSGAVSHDVIGHEEHVVPGDVAKGATAWARASRILPDADYRKRAIAALTWFDHAEPLGDYGFNAWANGAPETYAAPRQWRTNDLIMRCYAATELARDDGEFLPQASALAQKICSRQLREDEAEHGFHGHFYTFDDRSGPTLKAWTHHNLNREFGNDHGATFPFYLMPLLTLARSWPEHPDHKRWTECLHRFAYRFFLPACTQNPFNILPVGIFPGEGLLYFSGLSHGMNAAYGHAAALALELADFFDDDAFRAIAIGNLQWVSGLNAGITRESLNACAIFDTDITEDEALPASMICGIGERWAGTWLQTRGIICNGFCTGQQFRIDVQPEKSTDAPASLTDEDWITHAGGWLSAISRLAQTGGS